MANQVIQFDTHDLAYKQALKQISSYVADLAYLAENYGKEEGKNQQLDFQVFVLEDLIASQLEFLMFNERMECVLTKTLEEGGKGILTDEECELLKRNLLQHPGALPPRNYEIFYGDCFRKVIHKFIKKDFPTILESAKENRKDNKMALMGVEELEEIQNNPTRMAAISTMLLGRRGVGAFHANKKFVDKYAPLNMQNQENLAFGFAISPLKDIDWEQVPKALRNYLCVLFDEMYLPKQLPVSKGDFQNYAILDDYYKKVGESRKKLQNK